jgi:hypothetical protein
VHGIDAKGMPSGRSNRQPTWTRSFRDRGKESQVFIVRCGSGRLVSLQINLYNSFNSSEYNNFKHDNLSSLQVELIQKLKLLLQ